jgi:hypothetical protein
MLGTEKGTALLESLHHIYPRPIIDVIEANRAARVTLRSVMRREDTREAATKVFQKLGSRKKSMTKKQKPRSGSTSEMSSPSKGVQQESLF